MLNRSWTPWFACALQPSFKCALALFSRLSASWRNFCQTKRDKQKKQWEWSGFLIDHCFENWSLLIILDFSNHSQNYKKPFKQHKKKVLFIQSSVKDFWGKSWWKILRSSPWGFRPSDRRECRLLNNMGVVWWKYKHKYDNMVVTKKNNWIF
jgi:hypothetical protein